MRRIAKLLPYLAILLVLVIAGIYFFYIGPFQNRARETIARELESRTGLKAQVGPVQLHRGRVVLRSVTLTKPDGARLLTAPEVVVVLRGKGFPMSASAFREITEIRLLRPRAQLIREKDGRFDVSAYWPRERKGPPFTGRVTVQGGTLTFVDQTQGGVATTLEKVSFSYQAAPDGVARFTGSAVGAQRAWAMLRVEGERHPETGTTRLTGQVRDVDLVRAQRWFRPPTGLRVTAGRGDVDGEVILTRDEGGRTKIVPNVRVQPRGATLTFPWLRRPVTRVRGEVRVVGQQASLHRITGEVLGVPITAQGTAGLTAEPLLDLAFTVAGMRLAEIQTLLPEVKLPALLKVTSPVRVEATARGRPADLVVRGTVSAPEMTLACLPWHDVVAGFTWHKNRVMLTGLRAHGSPRRLEGDVEVQLGPGATRGRATLQMTDVPLEMLTACAPELKGLKLSGLATVSVDAAVDQGTALRGHFEAREVRYDAVALGRVSGDFTLGDQNTVRLTNGRVVGPTLTAAVSGSGTRAGEFTLAARIEAADLRRLGLPGLTGTARGPVRISGSLASGQARGHADLTLAGVLEGAVRQVTTDFLLSRDRLVLSKLAVQGRTGQATGDLTLTEWAKPTRAGLSGRLELTDVSVRDWLPKSAADLLSRAQATGTVTLSGGLKSPAVQADLRVQPFEIPSVGAGAGRMRGTYRAGELTLDEFAFESPQGRLQVQGQYTRARGLDFTLSEAKADLSLFSPYLQASGLTLRGPAVLKGSVKGQPANPTVEFEVTSSQFEANGMPGTNLDLAGRLADGQVTLRRAESELGEGKVSAAGSLNLHTTQTDFRFTATAVNLALASRWLRVQAGLAVAGTVNAEVSVGGSLLHPQGEVSVSSPSLVVNEVPFSNLSIAGRLRGSTLTFERTQFSQGEGTFTLGGTVDLLTRETNLTAKLQKVDIYRATLVFARAAARLDYLETTSQLLRFYASIPGPFEGTLEGEGTLTGKYDNPKAQAHVVLDHLTYQGRSLDQVTGDLTVAPAQGGRREIAMRVNAMQGEASAALTGTAVLGGEAKLALEANDLDLKALAPWLAGAKNLAGRAAVTADITGQTADPKLQGTVFVTDFRWGPLCFEAANFAQITLAREIVNGAPRRVLALGDVQLRNGPMTGTGRAQVDLPPLGTPWSVALLLPTASGELHVRNGRFAPLPEMTPAEFDADVYLRARRLVLGGAEDTATAGVRGRLGSGTFTVRGEVVLPESTSAESLALSRADLAANLEAVDLKIPGLLATKLSGQVLLRNDPDTGVVELATPRGQPLVISNGVIALTEKAQRPSFGSGSPLPFTPELDLHVVTGRDLRFDFSYVHARLKEGTLDVTGALSAEQAVVHGRVSVEKGTVDFPNARLDIVTGTVAMDREEGQPLTVRVVEAEAVGQVGDYEVALSPRGQLYPADGLHPGGIPLDLGARSTPFLDTPYILALLMGPLISPAVTGMGFDPLAVLTAATRPVTPAGAITGFMLPGLAGQNLALNYSFDGPLAVGFRQRMFGRLFGQYITPISGHSETRRLAFTYQFTSRYSAGWSINGLQQVRYQIQSFFSF